MSKLTFKPMFKATSKRLAATDRSNKLPARSAAVRRRRRCGNRTYSVLYPGVPYQGVLRPSVRYSAFYTPRFIPGVLYPEFYTRRSTPGVRARPCSNHGWPDPSSSLEPPLALVICRRTAPEARCQLSAMKQISSKDFAKPMRTDPVQACRADVRDERSWPDVSSAWSGANPAADITAATVRVPPHRRSAADSRHRRRRSASAARRDRR